MIVQIDLPIRDDDCLALMYASGVARDTYRMQWPRECDRIVDPMVRSCVQFTCEAFAEPVIEETVVLTQYPAGSRLPAHYDNCRHVDGRWLPNHTPQRVYSAIYYLNNIEGGELAFPDLDVVITPRRGRLIVFPSGQGYLHEVRKVTKGRRYALAIWMQRDATALPNPVDR